MGTDPLWSAPWVPPLAFFLDRYFSLDIWLDTFQVRAHTTGVWVSAALGHHGFPLLTPTSPPRDPVFFWCSWKQVLRRERHAGKLHTCHTMTWPQTHRLRYKDKYKYYSQNLCIKFLGNLGSFHLLEDCF